MPFGQSSPRPCLDFSLGIIESCGWIIVRRTHVRIRKITLSRWMEKKTKGWFTLLPEDKKKVVVSIMLQRMLKRKGRMFKFVRTRSSPVYFLKSVGPKYEFVFIKELKRRNIP